jgi:DNA polymerase-3 subunit alpha
LYESLDGLIAFSNRKQEEKTSQQNSLFGALGEEAASLERPALADVPDWPQTERLGHEFTAIGFYLSSHPLEAVRLLLDDAGVVLSGRFGEMLNHEYNAITIAGIVLSRKVKLSDKGRFAFIGLSDPHGSYEVSVFDEALLTQHWDLLAEGGQVLIQADGKMDDNGPRLIARGIQPLDDALAQAGGKKRSSRMRYWQVELQPGATPDMLKSMLPEPQPYRALHDVPTQDGHGAIGNLELWLPIGKEKVLLALPGAYALGPSVTEGLKQAAWVREMQEK